MSETGSGNYLLASSIWLLKVYIENKDCLIKDSLAKKERYERESNPRIEVLQTSALPLGYPAAV